MSVRPDQSSRDTPQAERRRGNGNESRLNRMQLADIWLKKSDVVCME
jgi:hypothetical protein